VIVECKRLQVSNDEGSKTVLSTTKGFPCHHSCGRWHGQLVMIVLLPPCILVMVALHIGQENQVQVLVGIVSGKLVYCMHMQGNKDRCSSDLQSLFWGHRCHYFSQLSHSGHPCKG